MSQLVNFFETIESSSPLPLTLILFTIIAILTVIILIESYKSEKFEKLFKAADRENKKLKRIKNTYITELKTFANLLDEITFPIWQRDKDHNIIYCN